MTQSFTEPILAEAYGKLRATKQRYQLAVDGAGSGIWDWTVGTDEMYYSPKFKQLLGYGEEEIKNTFSEWEDRLHFEDRDQVLQAFEEHLELGFRFDTEFRFQCKDGRYRWFRARGNAVRDERGTPLRMAGLITDTTNRKAFEKQLAEAQTLAEESSQSKSDFLATMSHEIRTPMTAIVGFADVLLGEEGIEKAPPERREAFETIKRNCDYLLTLINDILDLSKIEAGKLHVENLPCSPIEIAQEMAQLMQVRAQSKSLVLRVVHEGKIPSVIFSDPTRLRQILINLVGNAIKFTERGEVRVVSRLVHVDGLTKLQFDVIDTGIGITAEQIQRLFQPFSQADASTTRRYGGTGLGLTICDRLTQLLGGEINVTSQPGEGACFRFTIATGSLEGVSLIAPGEQDISVPKVATRKPETSGQLLNCRLLLAEDGIDNQRLISFLLRKAGAEVEVAENGQIATEMVLARESNANAETPPYDAVLMDMSMPVMDGYEATRQLRAAGYARPIIALTANAMAGARQDCLIAGCTDYAAKPIDREALITMIGKYTKQGAPA